MRAIKGYIKDYRKELNSDIWVMPPLYHRVWQYLKYMVNHQSKRIPMKDGSFMTIKPGQHLTSVRDIAKDVGWYEGLKWKEPNPKTISTILKWMQKQNMIHIDNGKGNRQYTLITLLNWEKYQIKTEEGNTTETVREQSADINKNDKECIKNDFIAAVDDNAHAREEVSGGVPTTRSADSTPDPDADSGQEQIPETIYRSKIADKYLVRRGYGFDLSLKDEEAIDELYAEQVPLPVVLNGIDRAFDQFKPKHKRDKINSLSYCLPAIYELFEKTLRKKRGDPEDGTYRTRGSRDPTESRGTEEEGGYYKQFGFVKKA